MIPKAKTGVGLHGILLFAVFAVAIALRFFGQNWDDGHLFHPDERHIMMVSEKLAFPQPFTLERFLSVDSPLNPKSFAYGSFSFYLLRGVSSLLGSLVDGDYARFEGMRFVGRSLSALFDLGSVLLVYLIGRKLFGRWVGLLGAAFTATSVLNIQLAHFFASDTILTAFVMLTIFLTIKYALGEGGSRYALLTGLAVGLALSTKISSAPIFAAIGVGFLLRAFSTTSDDGRLLFRRDWPTGLTYAIRDGLGLLAIAGVTFVVCQPYAIIDFKTFINNINEQNGMVRGVADLPYTRQYIDRSAYLYSLENLVTFGLGLPLGVTTLAGLLYIIYRNLRRPRAAELIILAWIIPYFLITGGFHTKFLRYLLPIIPLLCLFAAEGLRFLSVWANARFQPAAVPTAQLSPETEDAENADPIELDPEARRFAELKGFSPELLVAHLPTDAESDEKTISRPLPARLSRAGWAATALGGVVLLLTFLNALAYVRIYSVPHTAVAASRWVYANAPRGSVIATEHWEEGMPVSITDASGRSLNGGALAYRTAPLNLYEADTEAKLSEMIQSLTSADYIIFFSNRLYGTIPRLPERYPMSTEYYRLLFGEKLGFELVASFASYPNVAGVALVDDTLADPQLPTPRLLAETRTAPIEINLGHADESFSVYDHPKVLVFKKTRKIDAAEIRTLLRPALLKGGSLARNSQPKIYKSLLETPVARAINEAGGTFSTIFNRESIQNAEPITTWIVMVELLGLLAFPLLFLILPRFPDRGYLLAKTLSILLLSYIGWILVSLGLPLPGASSAYLSFFLLFVASGIAFYYQRRKIIAFVRDTRGILLRGEAIFWGAFLFFLIIRMLNPDLWHPARGGEKPMDLAYLMAAIKSTVYPPYDPWFAGGYLNYYYYGQIIVATLVKLSGIVPTTAYNLVIPLLFALTFAGAFSVVSTLLSAKGTGADSDAERSRHPYLFGFLGAVFVTIFGNLGGGSQLLDGLGKLGQAPSGAALPVVGDLLKLLAGILALISGKTLNIPTDWYWASTRVIEGTINEFPYFTFLYADLHAHLIALPLTLLTLGLAVEAVRTPLSDWTLPVPPGRLSLARFAAPLSLGLREVLPAEVRSRAAAAVARPLVSLLIMALSVGALMPTNSWDYPTYLVIAIFALILPWYLSLGRTESETTDGVLSRRVLSALVLRILALGALSYLFYLPFHRSFQSFYFGLKPIEDKSALSGYLTIHGFFLGVFLLYLATEVGRFLWASRAWRALWQSLRWWDSLSRLSLLRERLGRRGPDAIGLISLLAAGLVFFVAIVLALLGLGVIALQVTLFLLVAALALRLGQTPEKAFVLVLIGSGLVLGAITELVAIEGDVGRMNTVFKFYLQVWVMWGVAAAAALSYLLDSLRARSILRKLALAVVVVLALYSLAYPLVATGARIRDRFDSSIPPTLDGTAYMENAAFTENNSPIDLITDGKAIVWIQDNIEGSPTIVEGTAPLYHWGARVSIYTGLPTVIGWDWHQKQQRAGYTEKIDERINDVRTIYSDTNPAKALELLRKYGVSYIYVGQLERAYYSPNGIAKFETMVGRQLQKVYDNDGVIIYRVLSYEP